MDANDYILLREQLNTQKNIIISILIICIDLFLLSIAYHILTAPHGWQMYFFSQFCLALIFIHSFLLLHESGHHLAAKSIWANDLIGAYASIFCCLSYYPWKYIHREHHIWTGNMDKDPVFAFVKFAKITNHIPWIIRVGWQSWLPITIVYQYIVYWLYPIKLYYHGQQNKRLFYECLCSSLLLPICYISFHTLFPNFINFSNLWLAVLLYMILWEVISSPQHTGMPTISHKPKLYEQYYSTRTTRYNSLIGLLLFMNFGYHIEHHLFPSLPWYRLSHAAMLCRKQLNQHYNEAPGFTWSILSRRIDLRRILGLKLPDKSLKYENHQTKL